jgi:D-alanyl-lipoteichoic acid acyltransferase DltB (MBOAT superfamily)
MLFNSFQFVVFLPIVLLVYYSLPHKRQNMFLLIASCFFYACWDWRFLLPLLFSTTIDYICAYRIQELSEADDPQHRRRRYLALSVATNIGLLSFFKYSNFFSTSLQDLLKLFNLNVSLWTLRVILPIGISFYTFQALSYTIDVYRAKLHPTRNYWNFLLAVLYFPHLIAGPIQRAHSLLPQVMVPRVITVEKLLDGLHLICWGFFKKVFVADNLAPIVAHTFMNASPGGFDTLTGLYAFAFQIYCDFSGYTDIARGIAKIMGFEFMLNFNLPYLATNPSDFWSRWHISLSSWLRDYLYIPLGGSRNGVYKTCRNLMLTMVIGGLWHGAAWTFVLWGFYHGSLLILHRLIGPWLKIFAAKTATARALSYAVRVVFMFQLTCYGWLLFRANSFQQVDMMTRALMHPFAGFHSETAARIALIVSPLIVTQVVQFATKKLDFFDGVTAHIRAVAYAVMVYFTLFLGGQPQSFIYFQF